MGDKSRKGSIRRKINVLKAAVNIFDGSCLINVQETFIKNKVVCSLATSDGTFTLGFILEKNSKPLTLLKGNELYSSNPAELIIERGNDEQTIARIIINTNNLSESEIQALL